MKLTFTSTTKNVHLSQTGTKYRRFSVGSSYGIECKTRRATHSREVFHSFSKAEWDKAWRQICSE